MARTASVQPLSLSKVATVVKEYITAERLQNPNFVVTTDNLPGLVDKIAKVVSVSQEFTDPLAGYMDGDALPAGATIEEYYTRLPLAQTVNDPTDDDYAGPDFKPAKPKYGPVYYNYNLGKKKIKTTVFGDEYATGALSDEEAASMVAQVLQRLYDGEAVYRYAKKKGLIGAVAAKVLNASNASNLTSTIAAPEDTETGEAFIKELKSVAKRANEPNENNALTANELIGRTPKLVLYVDKNSHMMESIDVDTLAGAFNQEKLAFPVEIKEVDGFGSSTVVLTTTGGVAGDPNDDSTWAAATTQSIEGVYAVLMDDRTAKLHTGYRKVATDVIGEDDYTNYTIIERLTGFISGYTFVHIFKQPTD